MRIFDIDSATMNYLAHAFLSGDKPELLVGNFIADHVRGSDLSLFPEEIREGIRLHRKIDVFTDTHAAFRASKRLFYRGFERYSGILTDIYFDYFLAKDFEKFAGRSLNEFSRDVYEQYRAHEHLFPESSSRFLQYVMKNNVYRSYADIQGIETVLSHLSRRIGHNVALQDSMPLFHEGSELLQENFDMLFADLVKSFLNGPEATR